MAAPFVVRRILFATDLSEGSRRLGETAVSLARQFDARLTVLHVVPPVTDSASRRAATRSLAAGLESGVVVDADVVTGIAARGIVEYARDHGIDLIVMGTHGRTGVSHALLGSVAEAVVRRAPCPVLTVKASRAAEAVPAPAEPASGRCIVCAGSSVDLICEPCRAHIRGEALERKRLEERAGRV